MRSQAKPLIEQEIEQTHRLNHCVYVRGSRVVKATNNKLNFASRHRHHLVCHSTIHGASRFPPIPPCFLLSTSDRVYAEVLDGDKIE